MGGRDQVAEAQGREPAPVGLRIRRRLRLFSLEKTEFGSHLDMIGTACRGRQCFRPQHWRLDVDLSCHRVRVRGSHITSRDRFVPQSAAASSRPMK